MSVNNAQSDQFSAQKISQFFAPEAKLQQWIEYSWHFEDMSIFLSLLAAIPYQIIRSLQPDDVGMCCQSDMVKKFTI